MSLILGAEGFLQHIYQYLKNDLEKVNALICDAFSGGDPLIREVGEYLLSTPGKRIRPIIVVLSGSIYHASTSELHALAAATELLHTATLLHDDVIDKACVRRGRPTVNARWGDDVAILVADYLFCKSFDFVIAAGKPEMLRILTGVTFRMCEGEVYQIEKRGSFVSRDEYLRIIEKKTAHFFSACSALGAMVANAPADHIALLGRYGMGFGMAFQITDDTLDFVAQSERWGKSLGNDIAEGKQTLPLIIALESACPEEQAEIESCFNDGRDFSRISEFIKKYNGFERSLAVARDYARSARTCLGAFPDSSPAEMLFQLAEFAVERVF
jgi:octaprenyl-diphosphate synthase